MAPSRRRRPVRAQPPATFPQAPSPVPKGQPMPRVDVAQTGGTPPSRRQALRAGWLGAGAGLGLGLAGAGAGIGLVEGIPAAFGGQGPLASAINPDEPKRDAGPGALESIVGSPLTILVVGGLIVAALVLSKKGGA